jgi:hypothetical protein
LVNRQYLLFTETWRHSKFGSRLCKIRGEKHYTAFVKVVEGSETYNFPIHHLEHFYTFLAFDAFKAGYCDIVVGWPTPRRAAPPHASAATLGVLAARAPP